MKKVTMGLFLTSLVASACGPSKNDPLQKYKHLNLSKEAPTTSEKVVYKYQPEYIKGDKEIIYVAVPMAARVDNQVPVYINNCPENIVKDGETLGDCAKRLMNYIPQISLNGPVYEVKAYSDQNLQTEVSVIFKEGQESTYFIAAKVLYKSIVDFNLNFENLPVGSTLEEIETPDNDNIALYKIIWKPSLDLIKGEKISETSSMTTTLNVVDYKDTAENNYIMQITMKEVSKTLEVPLLLLSSEVPELKDESSVDLKTEQKNRPRFGGGR